MNQKRNQIEVSGYIRKGYLRFVISRSAVRVRSPAHKGSDKIQNLFCSKASKLTPSCNQKGNQWGVTYCKVIGKRVIRSQSVFKIVKSEKTILIT